MPASDYYSMPFQRIAIGGHEEIRQPGALKAALAEFFSTLIFVFAGQGSGIAFNKITGDSPTTPSGLIAAAIAHGFALFVAVAVGANISGGHVNPAVTFGAFIGGNITLFRGLLYIIAQLLGSIAACFLLKFSTGGLSSEEDLGFISTAFGLDPNSVKLNGHFISRGRDFVATSVTWKSLISFFSDRGFSTGATDSDAIVVIGKPAELGPKRLVSNIAQMSLKRKFLPVDLNEALKRLKTDEDTSTSSSPLLGVDRHKNKFCCSFSGVNGKRTREGDMVVAAAPCRDLDDAMLNVLWKVIC